MSRQRQPATATLVALLVALLLAPALVACGGTAGSVTTASAGQLLTKAKKQVVTQEHMRVKGKVTDSGTSIGIDLTYVGPNTSGSVTVNGDELDLLTVGGKSWFKGSPAFWRSQSPANAAQIISVVGDRWIIASSDNKALADLVKLTRRAFVTGQILSPTGRLVKGAKKKVDGVDCIALTAKDGTLWVATDDARPIRLESKASAKSPGRVDFTYGSSSTPRAPAAKDTVDLAKLGG